jgi:hypothetical protein
MGIKMPRPKKTKTPAPGENGAITPKIETPKTETPKYTIEQITNEEYRKFGHPDKSEIKQIAEEIIAKTMESNTPLKVKFTNIKVRQIIPVLSQLVKELKYKQFITIDFKASIKDNTIVIKKVNSQ